MSEDKVLLDIHKGVATVTLNRPDVHNAFDAEVIALLDNIFGDLAGKDSVFAVVLRGNGKSFSAGADLNWMKKAGNLSQEQNREDALKLARMLYKLYTLPQVSVACVKGAALGGGLGLVSCCDIVLADKNAKMGLSEVRLGLIPGTIGPYVLRAIGARQARRYFQTGERFSGAKGHDLGLVHELCESEDEMDELLESVIETLRKNGPKAMRESKKLVDDLVGRSITDEVLKETADRIAALRQGEEAQEGFDAFLNKRPPMWTRSG